MTIKTIDLSNQTDFTVRTQKIYTKKSFGDSSEDWFENIWMYCTHVSWELAPNIGTATLRHVYGVTDQYAPGVNFQVPINPGISKGMFVRIEIDGMDLLNPIGTKDAEDLKLKWWGIITDIHDDPFGGKASGVLTIECQDFGWFLARQQAWVSRYTFDSTSNDSDQLHKAPIVFNRGGIGNRSKNRLSYDVASVEDRSHTYLFSTEEEADEFGNMQRFTWGTRDIVEYLLGQVGFCELDKTDQFNVDTIIPNWDSPVVDTGNESLWDILSRLISRNRGLGFYVTVNDVFDEERIQVTPVSFAHADFTLPDGEKLLGNPDRIILKGQDSQSFVPRQSTTETTKYDAVYIYGGKPIYIFTLKYDQLQRGWSATGDLEYQLGASSGSAYLGASDSDKERLDSQFRSEPRFQDVYSRFGFNAGDFGFAWNFFDYEGNKILLNTDKFDDPPNHHFHGDVRFLPEVPLRPDYEYYHVSTPTRAVFSDILFETVTRPQVYFLSPDDGLYGVNRYVRGENISADRYTAPANRHYTNDFTVRVKVSEQDAFFNLVVSGRPQHWIAADDFTGNDYESIKFKSTWSFRNCFFTLAIEGTSELIGFAPSQVSGNFKSIKRIMAGDSYRVITVIKDTIVGVDENGELLKAVDNWELEDPTAELINIAETAWRWYGLARTTIDFHTGFISNDLDLGELIISIEDGFDITINAPTEIIIETTDSFNEGDPVLIFSDGGTMPEVNGREIDSSVLYVVEKILSHLKVSEKAGGTPIVFDTPGSNLFLTLASVNTPVTSKSISFPAALSENPELNEQTRVNYKTGYADIDFIE